MSTIYAVTILIIVVAMLYPIRLYLRWRWCKRVQLNEWVRVARNGFDFSKRYLVIQVRLNEVMVTDHGGVERGRWVPRIELRRYTKG